MHYLDPNEYTNYRSHHPKHPSGAAGRRSHSQNSNPSFFMEESSMEMESVSSYDYSAPPLPIKKKKTPRFSLMKKNGNGPPKDLGIAAIPWSEMAVSYTTPTKSPINSILTRTMKAAKENSPLITGFSISEATPLKEIIVAPAHSSKYNSGEQNYTSGKKEYISTASNEQIKPAGHYYNNNVIV